MDTFSAQMLEHLPDHLVMSGWRFVRRKSHRTTFSGVRRCVAIYERPYDPDVDDHRVAVVIDDTVQVSTRGMMSLTWRHAYQHAIEDMEFIDRRRRAVG